MSTQPTSPVDRLEFRVDAVRCVGCQACTKAFPQIFVPEGDKAVARPGSTHDLMRPLAVLRCCPVDAIVLASGTLPPPGEEVTSLPIVVGWESIWEAVRGSSEDIEERERRYGRMVSLVPVRDGWRWRIELPRSLPNSRWFVMHGIPNEAPEYDFTVEPIGPRSLSVRAWLTDTKLRFLAGKTNSFPVSLRADTHFTAPIGAHFQRFDGTAIEVYVFRDGTADPLASLRQAMLSD